MAGPLTKPLRVACRSTLCPGKTEARMRELRDDQQACRALKEVRLPASLWPNPRGMHGN